MAASLLDRTRLVAVVCAVLLCGCGDLSASGTFEPARPQTLTVVTEPLPTDGFWEGSDDRPTGGLEFAMARELAHRLGLERVEVRTAAFSRIVSGHLDGADVALAQLTPTEGRDRVLDFSTPYIHASPALVTQAGIEIPDVQTAQGMRFATQANTTLEEIVADVIRPDRSPLRYERQADKLDAIRSGRADVGLFDLPVAEAIVHADPRLSVAAKLTMTEPIAAALPEGSRNVEAVSAALRAMEADGSLDRLAERWLGTSLTDSENRVPLLRTGDR